MSINVKPGGGGKNEAYDTETGKYTSGKWANHSQSDEELISSFDSEISDIYNSLDDNQKKEFLEDMYNEFVSQETQNTMEERFEGFGLNEYLEIAAQCEQTLISKGVTPEDFDAFKRGYKGAGRKAFEFNKALRMGFKKYYSEFPDMIDDWSLNQQAIMKRAEGFDKLTRNFEIPRDGMVYRYLDENYLVAQFEKFGIFDDYDIFTDPVYKYRNIDRNKYSVQQLYDSLQNLIGCKIDGDGGFTSFSVVSDFTHMGKKHNTADTYKRIQIKYDIKKGTKCFISNYQKESEGVFPRDTKYFIKDIKLEKDDEGLERVVLYYGVQQDF